MASWLKSEDGGLTSEIDQLKSKFVKFREKLVNGELKPDRKVEVEPLEEIMSVEPTDEEIDPLPKNKKNVEICHMAYNFLSIHEWARAAQLYSQGLERHPHNAFLRASRALALLYMENLSTAEEDCTIALQFKPKFVKAYLRRAMARAGQDQMLKACTDMITVMELQPELKKPFGPVRKEYDKVVRHAVHEVAQLEDDQQTAEISAKLSQLEKAFGNELLLKKHFEEAIEKYTNAIVLLSNDPTFYANRAICWMELGKFFRCELDCTKALDIDGNYLKVLMRRANARKVLGDFTGARRDLSQAVKLGGGTKAETELAEVETLIDVLQAALERAENPASQKEEDDDHPNKPGVDLS